MEQEKGFDPEKILINVFDYWYFMMFTIFNDRWKEAKLGIMAFSQFFDRVFEQDFLPHHHQYMQDFIDKAGSQSTLAE